MAGKLLRAAIVGATTLLGKELAEELNSSPSAAWDLTLLDEGDSVGQVSQAGDEAVLIAELNAEAFQGQDIVFFAGRLDQTQSWWRNAINAGASLVDLTSALENEPGALLRSPRVAGGIGPDLTTQIAISATPAAQLLALVASRLRKLASPVRMIATVLEPASELGTAGLDEMQSQIVGLLSFQSVPKAVYDAQVAFNLAARLGDQAAGPLDRLQRRVAHQTAALLGSHGVSLELQLVQAPTFHATTASIFLDLPAGTGVEAVESALTEPGTVVNGETPASNQAAVESGEVMIDITAGTTGVWLWMAADNIKLAAQNAHACALELFALRPVGGVQ